MNNENQLTNINKVLFEAIKSIVNDSRKRVYENINRELITTYWKIGEEIVNAEHQNRIDSQTSRQIILNLSKILTKEIGRGFSRSNLFNMRKFHIEYPSCPDTVWTARLVTYL